MWDTDASFWQVLEARSSVRRYQQRPVPQEMLDKLVNAMKMAPVAGGNRNISCQIVSEPERIRAIADEVKRICAELMEQIPDPALRRNTIAYSGNFSWFGKAPCLLAVSCRKMPSYMNLLLPKGAEDLFGSKVSAAMAGQNILLAATAMGLGACCLTGPLLAKEWLHKELGCPGANELAFLITVGFPAKGLKDSGAPPEEE